MIKKKTLLFIITLIIVIVGLFHILNVSNKEQQLDTVVKNEENPVIRTYPIMGTWAQISLYGSQKNIDIAMSRIHKIFTEVNQSCSRFSSSDELYQLNKTAYYKPFKCSKMLWNVLVKSQYFYNLTDGRFDVTITPLMKLWGFYKKQNSIPSQAEVKTALAKVGLNKVIFDYKSHTVKFTKPGMSIDLGGIAKGYAVDLAYDSIKDLNIKAGVINLGGNIRCLPNPPPGKKDYLIGIRNPFNKSELMEGSLKLVNASLATSGDYEQYIILNGKRFTHIINPITGYPVKDMAETTIVAPSALWTDALSTSVFICGKKFAEKIHKKFKDISILIVKGYHDKPDTIKIYKYGKVWGKIKLPKTG
ncbi:MAG TPA: FAD:protein FMN transferase [Victivallales bacterium]|nr:FAD:protein FMN transferase [Victivallales bacterium]